MFHIDATFEDTRIIADSEDGHNYLVRIHDNCTGVSQDINLSSEDLAAIISCNLHPDGEPDLSFDRLQKLQEVFADWPLELRPIP
jgi:hypothetical protein